MNTDPKDRQEAYPRPFTTDNQIDNQPEYIDQQPNDFHDKSVSDVSIDNDSVQQGSQPEEDSNRN